MSRIGIRSSAIILKNDQVLLIHRKKEGREYWVFPGGGVEEGESNEDCVIREVKEETNLNGKIKNFAFMDFNINAEHPFYFVEVENGNLKLNGPEKKKNSDNNWYNPEWVSLEKFKKLNVQPKSAKEKLLNTSNFSF